jgi:hypothetical protein
MFFRFVRLDGGYAVPEMLDFFDQTKESFDKGQS